MNNSSSYIVIFDHINPSIKRISILGDTKSINQIDDFIKSNDINLSLYRISLTEKIESNSKSFCGTVMSNGDGNTIIEILNNSSNLIDLTSTGVDSNNISYFRFYDYNLNYAVPVIIGKIKEECQYFRNIMNSYMVL